MFRFILFGIAVVSIGFAFDVLLPKWEKEMRAKQKIKQKRKKEKAFKKKMKELEIL